MTILAVTPGPNAFPGVSRVFDEAEALFGADKFKHIYADALVNVPQDAYVLFGAWAEEYALPARRFSGRKGVLWSSPLLQSDLSDEHQALIVLAHIKSEKIVQDVWPMDRGFFEALAAGGEENVYWFPAPIAELPKAPQPAEKNSSMAYYHTVPHPRKNVLVQCLAAARAGYDVHAGELGDYAVVLQALGVKVTQHGWQPRDAYYNTLAGAGVSLSAFLSESFGYSVLDALALGVPAVTTPAVSWAPSEFMVMDPGDVRGITAKLQGWADPGVQKRMGRIGRHRAEKYAAECKDVLAGELKRAGLL